MKIGILIISIGKKYNNFCKNLLSSIYKNFCTDIDKKICVLGDDSSFLTNNEFFIHTQMLPPPLITLLRYNLSLQTFNYFEDCDIIYHFDSDLEVINKVDFSEVCLEKNSNLIAVKHPWQTTGNNQWLIENNKDSKAYIDNVNIYLQACFYGMEKNLFFKSYNELNENINIDLKRKIIAKWFDESHFNKYFSDINKKILSTSFCWPNSFNILPDTKIIHYNSYTNEL